MAKSRLHRLYNKFISSLSFSAELRKMRRELNAKIDQPESITAPPPFHPQAANRWFKRRRISIAESYLMVVRDLDSRNSSRRLTALKNLADVAFRSSSIDYPLNTARVQSALVKEVVKHRSNKRRQLELLYDFSMSTQGQHQVIRKLCDELNIIELPENGMKIGELGYAWDDHVHDVATSGRKNPTQLVLDAFIKGISSLTVAYGLVSDIDLMEEVLEAGNILGLKVNIGLEFSVLVEGARYHFIAELPHFSSKEELRSFFSDHALDMDKFFKGLEINRESRLDAVRRLLENFNQNTLPKINEGFENKPEYCLAPLSLEVLLATIPNVNITPLHLAEFMYVRYRPILQKRVWYYKVLREKARYIAQNPSGLQQDQTNGELQREEIEASYSELKKELNRLSPDLVLSAYFDSPHIISYQSAFDDLESISQMLKRAGCSIRFVQPLEHGLELAKQALIKWSRCIDAVEIYNIQDCIGRNPESIEDFARFVNELNKSAAAEGRSFLKPICGSDATGRNPKIPGMGFIFEDQIIGNLRKRYIKRHMRLPSLISAMIRSSECPVDEASLQNAAVPSIVCMGKISGSWNRAITGDEERINPLRAWRYFNPTFKNAIRAIIGFTVATAYIGPAYALLWLGITGFRNSIADLISYRGPKLSQWKLKSINFDNVGQSLFWTGFSVPLMGYAKSTFDILWPLAPETFLFNLVKFFVISIVNGFYLAAHNTLRGFDTNVVRANLFRSILAWPLATIFAPIGNSLSIPSIVQTKIWSDVVAGFIEGGNKYRKVLQLRQKTLEELIPTVINASGSAQYIATMDVLYLFSQEPRTRTTIKAILSPYAFFTRKLKENSSLRLNMLLEFNDKMSKESLWTDLVDYIVANYEEDMADDLVDLVVDGLPELLGDLSGLIEKYGKDPSLLAKLAAKASGTIRGSGQAK